MRAIKIVVDFYKHHSLDTSYFLSNINCVDCSMFADCHNGYFSLDMYVGSSSEDDNFGAIHSSAQ